MNLISFDDDESYRTFTGKDWSFLVLSRALVRAVAPNTPYIVISITDPHAPLAEIRDSPHLRDLLRLSFHDTGDYGQPLGMNIVMEHKMGETILGFVRGQAPDVKTIVCHCEAGVSRSAAVAAALAKILGEDNAYFFANFSPNRWVYKTVLDVAAEQERA